MPNIRIKSKIYSMVKSGWYVEELIKELGITMHRYYKLRKEDQSFDRKIRNLLENREEVREESIADQRVDMFDEEAWDEEEIERRTDILRIMRKNSVVSDYQPY